MMRIGEFELATTEAGHPWVHLDLHGRFAKWVASVDEAERAQWFANPVVIDTYADHEWKELLADELCQELAPIASPERTILALTGLMDLYDFVHVAPLIAAIGKAFPGFLLMFFPGEREGNNYRFLNVRPGWDYLAIPILSNK